MTRPETALDRAKQAIIRRRSKVTQEVQGPSTTCITQHRSAWTARRARLARKQKGGAQSKQATRSSISLTRTWFSLTPLQASWRLWLRCYFILAWQWRYRARHDPVLGVEKTCLDPQVPKCLLGCDTWPGAEIRISVFLCQGGDWRCCLDWRRLATAVTGILQS
jgi:hypothetical protein